MSKPLTRPFKCSVCSRPFTRQENLKRHVQTHHPSPVSRTYPCPQCEARFSRSDLRKRHIRNCHISPDTVMVIEDEICFPSSQSQESDDLYMPTKKTTPESLYFNAFFSKFHPTMPTLHEPTFHQRTAPKALVSAVICIGALYGSADSRFSTSKSHFEDAYTFLYEYTKKDRSRFQEIWVLQTYILLAAYGIYVCDDALVSKAQQIHHTLIGAIREFQMTHDGRASRMESRNPSELMPVLADADTGTLQERWEEFIREESRKRCIYSIYLLDSQLSIACNLRPQISALEIKYDQPCADDLWSAATAEAWNNTSKQLFQSFNKQDDIFGSLEVAPSQGSLFEGTQDLLFGKIEKGPPTLRLLWYSPFAALVLVTQLQMMARELTHATCLLERPKNPQKNLSILTEHQYGQISQALRNIAELVPKAQSRDAVCQDPGNATLWHSFWMTWHYTSISISHPDSLLISGVVETNLPAAIATAGHLARPRCKENRDIYEDRDVFRILNDLESALAKISHGPSAHKSSFHPDASVTESTSDVASLENPFLTLLAFKICLVGWRIVRLTMADAAKSSDTFASISRYNPAKFVLQSIMTAITKDDGLFSSQEWAWQAEVDYLRWVKATLMRRKVWPVGRWGAAIVEDAAAEAAVNATFVRDLDLGLI